jgi:hypothetical protein
MATRKKDKYPDQADVQPGQQSATTPDGTHAPREVGEQPRQEKGKACAPESAPGAKLPQVTEDGSQAPLSVPTGGTGAPHPGSSGIRETSDPNYSHKDAPDEPQR